MPLYEYECARCGKRFELLQKFSDAPEAACVACGAIAHRPLSPPAFQFKGSGWYVTDYARKSSSAEKTDGKGEPKAKTEPASKSEESKSATPAKESS